MTYYLITQDASHAGFIEISTIKPHINVLDCDFSVEEFESFSEAKSEALRQAIYRRDCLRDDIRELRALRKRDLS